MLHRIKQINEFSFGSPSGVLKKEKKKQARIRPSLVFPYVTCVSMWVFYSSLQFMRQVFLRVKDVSQMMVPCYGEGQKTELLGRLENDKQGAHCTLPYSISPPAPQLAIPSLSIILRYIHGCKHSLSMTAIILIYHLYLIILIYWVLSMIHTVF